MATNGRRTFLIISCVLILSLMTLVSFSTAEVAVIKVNYRTASDLLPLVESLLSPGGKASVDERTNSMIVSDTSESVAKIRAFVARMDKPAEQVKIRLRFRETSLSRERDLSVSGRVSGERWSIATGERRAEGVHVRARDRKVHGRGTTEAFISVMSGSSAYIWVGKNVPFTERWVYLCRRYARVVEGVNFQRVETGMEVRPVVAGDRVHIDIIPRISSVEEGEHGVVRFTEASTKLTALRGQWITIGGTSEKSNEVMRDILSTGGSSTRSSLSLSLMVE